MKRSIYRRFLLITATLFTLIGIGLLIWVICRGYRYEKFIDSGQKLDLPTAGLFGDFVGGFIGTIFAFVGLLLLYETLSLQRREFASSKQVFTKQQFDNTFFELLKLYKSIVDQISVIDSNGRIKGKKFFDVNMSDLQNSFTTARALSFNRRTAVSNYQDFYVKYKNITSVYFKTLYRIYCLIEYSELTAKDKGTYAKILRAQLSDSELFFIRYNAMTDDGRKSANYLNKYNILKHLSHFELLEFKDWWSLVTPYERNGLDYLFREIKEVLTVLIDKKELRFAERKFGKRYVMTIESQNISIFNLTITRDVSVNLTHQSIVSGLDRFSNQQIENLLECIIKELIISSNFNQFNNRRNLNFFSNTSTDGSESVISAGVSNLKGEKLVITHNGM